MDPSMLRFHLGGLAMHARTHGLKFNVSCSNSAAAGAAASPYHDDPGGGRGSGHAGCCVLRSPT